MRQAYNHVVNTGNDSEKSLTLPDADAAAPDSAPGEWEVPAGNHALEVAARRGFGPLSPLARSQWHGQSVPCVSCGQLVPRGDDHCGECGQDLSESMLERMKVHAGPWFVLEHVRPFPGVSLERIIRQIRRGLLTETSIVRGPATDFQWRFAVETPGLCRYFSRCWHCHHQVSLSDTHCHACLSRLSFDVTSWIEPKPARTSEPKAAVVTPAPQDRTPAVVRPAVAMGPGTMFPRPSPSLSTEMPTPSTGTNDWKELVAAVRQAEPPADSQWEPHAPVDSIRATWVAVVVMAIVVVGLFIAVQMRETTTPVAPPPAAPSVVAPPTATP